MGRDRRFAVVPGPSGSGTSSHLRAGLIPRLRAHITRRHSPAVLRVLTPGAKPAGTYGRLLTLGEDDPEGWVIVVGSRKFSPCAVIPRSAPASSTCCWPQVIETADRVWLWRSGPTSTPGARSIPDRGLSPTRTPRPATPRPRRAADPRHDERLRLLSKADVAEDQLPACTPRSARPRGPHRRGDVPLHPRGDHRPHRPGHGAAPVPGHRTDPPAAPPTEVRPRPAEGRGGRSWPTADKAPRKRAQPQSAGCAAGLWPLQYLGGRRTAATSLPEQVSSSSREAAAAEKGDHSLVRYEAGRNSSPSQNARAVRCSTASPPRSGRTSP